MYETMKTINVLDVPIAVINMHQAIEMIENCIKKGPASYINIVNVHSVMEAQKDLKLMNSHKSALICTADGMPLVWVGRFYGHGQMERIYGPALMKEVMRISNQKGYSHYFIGGKSGVPELMRDRFLSSFPNLRIVGTQSPPFRTMNRLEEDHLKHNINRQKPDILWVGLGCPKQEIWMNEHLGLLDVKIMIGVGAAFDFHAGIVKQAPAIIQRYGLEWAFRLCMEPKRLWRRYLTTNPLFLYKMFVQLLGGRRIH
jgi:N-acetylglucosaminyldiphosphoundecaprenol N-acetyl-beta-D-mannosaminyltransferase